MKSELKNFENCIKYNLENCNFFQISMNYKNEDLELKYLKSIASYVLFKKE